MEDLKCSDFSIFGVETRKVLIDLLKHTQTHPDRDLVLCHSLVCDYFKRIDHKADELLSTAHNVRSTIDREYFIENTIAR